MSGAWSRPLSWGRWIALVALLAAVVAPRFNLNDLGIVHRFTATAKATPYGLPLDVEGYVRLVQYHRGVLPADSLLTPYCYRPLIPFAASRLPFDPLTSIDVVDFVCLLLSVVALDGILGFVGFGVGARTLGSILFIVSFPTFYYGTIGFIDPGCVLLVSLGTLYSLRRKTLLVALCVVVGALVKETNVLIALLPGIVAWARHSLKPRAAIQVALLVLLGLSTVLCVRLLSPFPGREWLWIPRWEILRDNLARPRAYLSFALTLGLPAALAALAVIRDRARGGLRREDYRFFAGGVILILLVYLYTLPAAHADGRIVWVIYPFLIPIALTAIVSPRPRAAELRAPA